LLVEFGLDSIEQFAIKDWFLLASQNLVPVFDLADIETVAEQVSKRTSAEEDASDDFAGR
jgi:hypothetical protein